jgi:hypothetical protein
LRLAAEANGLDPIGPEIDHGGLQSMPRQVREIGILAEARSEENGANFLKLARGIP